MVVQNFYSIRGLFYTNIYIIQWNLNMTFFLMQCLVQKCAVSAAFHSYLVFTKLFIIVCPYPIYLISLMFIAGITQARTLTCTRKITLLCTLTQWRRLWTASIIPVYLWALALPMVSNQRKMGGLLKTRTTPPTVTVSEIWLCLSLTDIFCELI